MGSKTQYQSSNERETQMFAGFEILVQNIVRENNIKKSLIERKKFQADELKKDSTEKTERAKLLDTQISLKQEEIRQITQSTNLRRSNLDRLTQHIKLLDEHDASLKRQLTIKKLETKRRKEKLESLYQTAVDAKAKQKDFYSSIPLITELSNRINKQCQTVHAEVVPPNNNTNCDEKYDAHAQNSSDEIASYKRKPAQQHITKPGTVKVWDSGEKLDTHSTLPDLVKTPSADNHNFVEPYQQDPPLQTERSLMPAHQAVSPANFVMPSKSSEPMLSHSCNSATNVDHLSPLTVATARTVSPAQVEIPPQSQRGEQIVLPISSSDTNIGGNETSESSMLDVSGPLPRSLSPTQASAEGEPAGSPQLTPLQQHSGMNEEETAGPAADQCEEEEDDGEKSAISDVSILTAGTGAESQSDMPADRFMSFLREGGADAESGNESPLSCGAFFGDNEESSKTEAVGFFAGWDNEESNGADDDANQMFQNLFGGAQDSDNEDGKPGQSFFNMF